MSTSSSSYGSTKEPSTEAEAAIMNDIGGDGEEDSQDLFAMLTQADDGADGVTTPKKTGTSSFDSSPPNFYEDSFSRIEYVNSDNRKTVAELTSLIKSLPETEALNDVSVGSRTIEKLKSLAQELRGDDGHDCNFFRKKRLSSDSVSSSPGKRTKARPFSQTDNQHIIQTVMNYLNEGGVTLLHGLEAVRKADWSRPEGESLLARYNRVAETPRTGAALKTKFKALLFSELDLLISIKGEKDLKTIRALRDLYELESPSINKTQFSKTSNQQTASQEELNLPDL